MKKTVTLTRWIAMLLLLFWLGLILLCFFISIYTGTVMRRQAEEASETLLHVYLEKMDSNAEGIDRFLSQMPSSNASISTMVRTGNPTEHYFARLDAMRQLRNASFIYNTFNGIFLYARGKLETTFLCQLRDGTGMVQQEDIRSVVTSGRIGETDGWQIMAEQERVYLLRTVWSGDACCGVWLDPSSAIEPLGQMQVEKNSAILMLDREGNILSDGGFAGCAALSLEDNGKMIRLDGRRYLQIGCRSSELPVELVVLIPESIFAGQVHLTQAVIVLVFSVVLLLLPALWYLMNREVSRPVVQLTETMSRVGGGDLMARASEASRFAEFREIAGSFNRMTGQIQQLRQDIYERQLSEQRTQLQYLQMQIRPHFFLNAMNIIYSFSLTGRNDLIEQLTLCLSRYFRYIFRCESAFVPLSAELEHIHTYLEIIRLRDQGEFSYHREIDEVLLETLIPPLTIQPFVENSVKYACSEGGGEIDLIVECRQIQGEQMLCITVRDGGGGYPEEILEQFDHENSLPAGGGRRIGLTNVRQRLRLTYGEQAQIHIGNIPDGGACSELILPLRWPEEEGEE